MITNREQYKEFLRLDALAMGLNPDSRKEMFRAFFLNVKWQFIKKLRRVEYYGTKRANIFYRFLYYIFYMDYQYCSLKRGFFIPPNICGSGLSLPHYGTIVISTKAKIGKNVRIHVCVNIGETEGKAPIIGDNVFISPGVKIFGNIKIGNNVKIGANAVVNKTFDEDNIVLAGVPAKIVKRIAPLNQ